MKTLKIGEIKTLINKNGLKSLNLKCKYGFCFIKKTYNSNILLPWLVIGIFSVFTTLSNQQWEGRQCSIWALTSETKSPNDLVALSDLSTTTATRMLSLYRILQVFILFALHTTCEKKNKFWIRHLICYVIVGAERWPALFNFFVIWSLV